MEFVYVKADPKQQTVTRTYEEIIYHVPSKGLVSMLT